MQHQPIPLILTRPQERAAGFVQALDPQTLAGVRPIYAPLWRIEPTDAAVPDFDAAIFTSMNGVVHGPSPGGRAAFCVGQVTTRAAQAAGWAAHYSGANAAELITSLVQIAPTEHLLHVSGAQTRGDVAETLRAAGLKVERHIAYSQLAQKLGAEAQAVLREEHALVPLFSPAGAAHFAAQVRLLGARFDVIAISQATAEALGNLAPHQLVIAAQPNADAMRAEIAKQVRAALSG
ncbi:MAG: uroporphyrinogen-III synthase [Pseudomonadota bacterium]